MAASPKGLQLRGAVGWDWVAVEVLVALGCCLVCCAMCPLSLFLYIFYIQEQKELLNTVQSLRICEALLLRAS